MRMVLIIVMVIMILIIKREGGRLADIRNPSFASGVSSLWTVWPVIVKRIKFF